MLSNQIFIPVYTYTLKQNTIFLAEKNKEFL